MLEVILFIVLTGCLIGLSLFFLAWSKQNSGQGKRFSTPQEIVQREREIAQQAREMAQRERQIADQERERSQKLAAKLRELGIDPDEL